MKKLFQKSLLVAAGLLVGASAWAVTVTETYDFGGFITSNGAPGMSLGSTVVATQSGTSNYTGGDLYQLNNPTNNGQTLELNNRFAIDYGANANVQIRFMWRSSSNSYQHGLAGNWNSKGNANTACHLSVLNLKEGDKITFTYAVQNGRAAQPYLCKTGVVTGVEADAYLASGTEYTIAAAGNLDIYFKNNNFAVSKIVIVTEKEGDETMGAPSIDITAVDGNNRTVTITPGVGDGGSAATATYYTLDGSEPSSTNGTAYTVPFTLSATTTVKAVSYLNEAIGEIAEKSIEAGTAIELNAPSIVISDVTANGEYFAAAFGATSNQSSVLLKPAATLTATFNGNEVTLPYTPTEKGTLTVTASATGYTSAETSMTVYPSYVQEWQSLDFSAIAAEDVATLLGENWALQDGTGRWASWKDQAYTYYSDGATSNITVNERLRMRGVIALNLGFGLGRNITGGEAISVTGTSTDDIVAFEIYNGFGNAINKGTNTFMSYAMSNGSDNPQMSSNNGALFVQATVYAPIKYTSMSIAGDFSENEWDPANGIAMTRDENNINLWTAIVENFVAENKTYSYKATANNNWDDYVLPSGDNKTIDLTAGTYKLTFTVNTKVHTLDLVAEKQVDYTVVGSFNDADSFFGTAWDVANNDNNLVSNGDGTYSKTFYSVALEAGTILYQVVEGHSWDAQWGFDKTDANPDGNADYGVNAAGTYDITFTFDPINKLSNGYNLTCEVTATPATVAKTISAAGYATYCSPYALDFSEVSGLKAYIATQDGDSIKFVRVNSVPAETGVLLKGEGEYNINVVASAEAVEGNLLVGVLADTKVAAGNFVLMNGNDGVGFYKTTKEFTVGANTAYLEGAAGGARMFIGFDENTTTTAINAVAAEQMNGEVYNLKGQRVAQPTKGLYIVNGKKVVLK